MSPRHSSAPALEHVLLALLDQRPLHGYELYQELCNLGGISLIWNIKQALFYSKLEKLEEGGLLSSEQVQSEISHPRKYFKLTKAGRALLKTWLETPVHRTRDLRQEFLAKLIIGRRYGKEKVLELIHVQEKACQFWLDELRKSAPLPTSEYMDEMLVYSFRINQVEGALQWLTDLKLEIEHIPDSGPTRGD